MTKQELLKKCDSLLNVARMNYKHYDKQYDQHKGEVTYGQMNYYDGVATGIDIIKTYIVDLEVD